MTRIPITTDLARRFWWWFRGVTPDNFRRVCRRCGKTGQAHWTLGCWRFRA